MGRDESRSESREEMGTLKQDDDECAEQSGEAVTLCVSSYRQNLCFDPIVLSFCSFGNFRRPPRVALAAGAMWRRASFAWHAWHLATSAFVLCGRRGTWRHLSFAWQAWHLATSAFVLCGRRGTWLWQAWHLRHWAGSGGGFGCSWCPVAPRLFCVADVALGDISLRSVWQAWPLATSAFVLCGRRCTYGTGLALVAEVPCGAAPLLRGMRGTWRHPPSFCVAGVALGDIYGFGRRSNWRSMRPACARACAYLPFAKLSRMPAADHAAHAEILYVAEMRLWCTTHARALNVAGGIACTSGILNAL
eukprot:s1999_g4.t1